MENNNGTKEENYLFSNCFCIVELTKKFLIKHFSQENNKASNPSSSQKHFGFDIFFPKQKQNSDSWEAIFLAVCRTAPVSSHERQSCSVGCPVTTHNPKRTCHRTRGSQQPSCAGGSWMQALLGLSSASGETTLIPGRGLQLSQCQNLSRNHSPFYIKKVESLVHLAACRIPDITYLAAPCCFEKWGKKRSIPADNFLCMICRNFWSLCTLRLN